MGLLCAAFGSVWGGRPVKDVELLGLRADDTARCGAAALRPPPAAPARRPKRPRSSMLFHKLSGGIEILAGGGRIPVTHIRGEIRDITARPGVIPPLDREGRKGWGETGGLSVNLID